MRLGSLMLAFAVLLGSATSTQAAESPALIEARNLYNAADFDGAIAAAMLARVQDSPGDVALLVLGRAHLERYRLSADAVDLASARDALAAVRATALEPREQVDLLVGLGQSLFLAGTFGAAEELFDTAWSRSALLPVRDRTQLLDWWATALDREAQAGPADRRHPLFDRLLSRMESEVRDTPGNGPANYWLAVAARGAGDVDRAWNLAIAGWVRSNLSPDTAASLRADLDQLVIDALIPERARAAADPLEAILALRAEWEAIKTEWR